MALARDDNDARGVAATKRGKHFVEQVEMRQMVSLKNKIRIEENVFSQKQFIIYLHKV